MNTVRVCRDGRGEAPVGSQRTGVRRVDPIAAARDEREFHLKPSQLTRGAEACHHVGER